MGCSCCGNTGNLIPLEEENRLFQNLDVMYKEYNDIVYQASRLATYSNFKNSKEKGEERNRKE